MVSVLRSGEALTSEASLRQLLSTTIYSGTQDTKRTLARLIQFPAMSADQLNNPGLPDLIVDNLVLCRQTRACQLAGSPSSLNG